MEPYRGKKFQDMDKGPSKKQKYHKEPKNCPDGYLCELLQLNNGRCKFRHTDEEIKKSKELQQLTKNKKTVVIFQKIATVNGKQSDMMLCIFHKSLPFELINEQKKENRDKALEDKAEKDKIKDSQAQTLTQTQSQLEKSKIIQKKEVNQKIQLIPGFYYQAQYCGVDKSSKQIKLKIKKRQSKFGQIDYQLSICRLQKPPSFQLDHDPPNRPLTGTIKHNWQGTLVLTNSQGLHNNYYLTKQQQNTYPLSQGCTVLYTGGKSKHDKLRVYEIKYDKWKFSGVLRIDGSGVLYVKCRNWRHRSLDVVGVSEEILALVKEMEGIFPYSIFNRRRIDKNTQNSINQELKKYLFRGSFNSWPENLSNPIGNLQPQFSSFGLKSLKQAIIYQYLITPMTHSPMQKKQSKKLLQQINKKKKAEKQKPLQQYVFTLDGKGTACHDDAITIKKSPQSQDTYTIGIHISDVDQYVPSGTKIDEQVRRKDRTMYIKGFYSPMFEHSLMKHLSLQQGRNKLTYSLFFNINKQGLIDFNSINFKQTCIKVNKNYFHNPKLKNVEQLKIFYEVSGILKRSPIFKQLIVGLQEQQETEGLISILMLLSSMIPWFMIKMNVRKIQEAKGKITEFIEQILQKISKLIGQWEKIFKDIKANEKEVNQILRLKNSIKRQIQKQVNKQLKRLKQEQKQRKKIQKAQKKKKQKDPTKPELQKQQQQSQQSSQAQPEKSKIPTQQDLQQQQQKKAKKQKEQQQAHQKKLKQVTTKKIKMKGLVKDDDSQLSESESEVEDTGGDEGRKMKAAERAFRYLGKVFSILGVEPSWDNKDQIRKNFTQAKKFNSSQIFQQYIKRMYIINHQHFINFIKISKNINKTGSKTSTNNTTNNQNNKRTRQSDNQIAQPLNQPKITEVNQKRNKKQEQKVEKEQRKKGVTQSLDNNSQKFQLKVQLKQHPKGGRNQNNKQGKFKQKTKYMQIKNQSQKQEQKKQKPDAIKQQNLQKIQQTQMQTNKDIKVKQNLANQQVNKKQDKKQPPKINYLQQKQLQQVIDKYLKYFQWKQKKYLQRKLKEKIQQKQQKLQNKEVQQQNNQKVQAINIQQSQNNQQIQQQKKQKPKQTQNNTKKNKRKELEKKLSKISLQKYINLQFLLNTLNPEVYQSQNKKYEILLQKDEVKQIKQQDVYLYVNLKQQRIKQQIYKNQKINFRYLQNKADKNCQFCVKDSRKSLKQQLQSYENIKSHKDLKQLKEYILDKKVQKIKYFISLNQNSDKTNKKNEVKFINKCELMFYLQSFQGRLNRKYFQQCKHFRLQIQDKKQNVTKKPEDQKKQNNKKQKNKSQNDKIVQELKIKQQKVIEQTITEQKCIKTDNQNETKTLNQDIQNKILPPSMQKPNQLTNHSQAQSNNQQKQQKKQQIEKKEIQQQKKQEQKKPIRVQKLSKKKQKQQMRLKQQKIRQQISQKYSKQLMEKEQQIKKFRQKIQQSKKQIKSSLLGINSQYNVLEYILQKLNKNKKANEKKKKNKQKKDQKIQKEEQKQQGCIQQFNKIQKLCSLVHDYQKKSQHKFPLMKVSQIQAFLKQSIKLEAADQESCLQMNKQFSQPQSNQSQPLKWTNPIRSYQALQTLRLLKNYQWLFNSQLSPLDILIDYGAIRQARQKIEQLRKARIEKEESENLGRKYKEANREIGMLEFFWKLKAEPGKKYRLLNVTSPREQSAKFVYHPTLGEIEIENHEFKQQMFREVEGEIKIVSEWPMEMKAFIIG